MRKKNLLFSFLLTLLSLVGCDKETQGVESATNSRSEKEIFDNVVNLVTDFQDQVAGSSKSRANSLIVDACEKKTYTVALGTKSIRSVSDLADSTQVDVQYIRFHQDTVSGFAVASSDPRLNRVYAFVEAGNIEDTVSVLPLKWAIEKIPGIVAEDIQMYYEHPQARSAITNVFIGPLIKTQWDQAAPYCNYIASCSSNTGSPYYGHCPAGCVPLALAQVIAYCKRFRGTYYGNKDIDFATLTSVPSISRTSTSSLAKQAATFVHEIAMYCQVDFECGGSHSQLKDGYQYLKELGYTCSYKESGLDINALYNNLKNGRPHLSGGVNGSSGHVWIIDGIKGSYNGSTFTEFTVHCNWGLLDVKEGWVADYRQPTSNYVFSKESRQVYITNY